MAREILSWIKTILLALLIAIIIRNHVFALYMVDGTSMQPTLDNGEILVVNNFTYRFWEPKRGDVIVFQMEGVSSRKGNWLVGGNALVKRVIALPGDTVYIDDGQVFVNDQPLAEEYVDFEITGSHNPVTLEEGWLFVLGDNRHPGGSFDSRGFGPIPISAVLGKAEFVLHPSPHKVD